MKVFTATDQSRIIWLIGVALYVGAALPPLTKSDTRC